MSVNLMSRRSVIYFLIGFSLTFCLVLFWNSLPDNIRDPNLSADTFITLTANVLVLAILPYRIVYTFSALEFRLNLMRSTNLRITLHYNTHDTEQRNFA